MSNPTDRIHSIQGISYSPTPSDDTAPPPQKYFDSDFTNSTFNFIWIDSDVDDGRGDVENLAAIGVNLLHLYDWSVPPAAGDKPGPYQRSHVSFLQQCESFKVNLMIPVSNYFLTEIHNGNGSTVKTQIAAMLAEFYATRGPTDSLWSIGNEYDLATEFSVDDVVQAMVYLVDAEQTSQIPPDQLLPVTSPVSFATGDMPDAPGIAAIKKLQQAIEANPSLGKAFWKSRFIASTNPFNDGAYLVKYIDSIFPAYYPDLPFFFAEMGVPIKPDSPVTNETEQAVYLLDQLMATKPRANFLGRCVFQFLDQTAVKTGSEATFGINEYAGTFKEHGVIPTDYTPGGGQEYPVDDLTRKPAYQSVVTAYKAP